MHHQLSKVMAKRDTREAGFQIQFRVRCVLGLF